MLTFLHHSDPTIPHYRGKEWSFLRGALATVDRPLLGWAGRFFLHNVRSYHDTYSRNDPSCMEILGITWSYCSSLLFRNTFLWISNQHSMDSLIVLICWLSDNQPQVTECIKTVLKDEYNYDSTVRTDSSLYSYCSDIRVVFVLRLIPVVYGMLLYRRRRWRRFL